MTKTQLFYLIIIIVNNMVMYNIGMVMGWRLARRGMR
jgi:hypothetical protein